MRCHRDSDQVSPLVLDSQRNLCLSYLFGRELKKKKTKEESQAHDGNGHVILPVRGE